VAADALDPQSGLEAVALLAAWMREG